MQKQTELKQATIPLPRHAITWLFPFLAMGYFDGTVAMLLLMFCVPVIGLFIFLMDKIVRRFSYENQFRVLLSCLSLILTGVVLFWGYSTFSANKMFESVIISPIPKTVNIIDKSGQLSVMGMSSFSLMFDISSEDFDIVLNTQVFDKKNISNIEGRKPELYKKALEEAKEFLDATELYVIDDKSSVYRCTVVVTNKEHDKVYYRIF